MAFLFHGKPLLFNIGVPTGAKEDVFQQVPQEEGAVWSHFGRTMGNMKDRDQRNETRLGQPKQRP